MMTGLIYYNFPAMLELVTELESYSASLEAVGNSIQAQQRVLANSWEGVSALAYQNWQEQWNAASELLAQSLRNIALILASNTASMAGLEASQTAMWASV